MRLPEFTSVILTVFVIGTLSEPCPEYGCPHPPKHEPFLPAPPGQTPRCAKPGDTFCETLDHYPQQLIRFLVDKWSFDYKRLLVDETEDEFNAYRMEPEYHEGYEYRRPNVPSFPGPSPFLPTDYHFNPPSQIYGPPTNTTHQQGYSYQAPPKTTNNPFLQQRPGISHQVPHVQQQIPHHLSANPFHYRHTHTLDPLGQSPGWLGSRYTRSNERSGVSKSRPSRSMNTNPLLEFGNSKRTRSKRQIGASQGSSLCLTKISWAQPKAALNSEGKWIYVVNLEGELGNTPGMTQYVRSDKCAADTCDNLCSLPVGYTGRCEQQYVQKRLVALDGSGNNLYTDIFWFPHCCLCKVMLDKGGF